MKPLVALALVAALVGCDSLSGPESEAVRLLGEPAMASQEVEPLMVPDTVAVGEPFEVTVVTQGGGCHERADGLEVDAGGQAVELRPYDIVLVPRSDWAACTRLLRYLPRTATVTLAEPGRRLLRVVGGRGLTPESEPVVVERVVVVEER